mgnify:CR=1 FL=1
MADRFISSGHTYLHWQRICLECTYQAGYGSYGIISGTDNMGIFYCHSFPGAVGRVPWWFCGAHGAFPLWPAFGMLLCPGDAGNRICDIREEYERCCICFMALSEGLGWEPDTLLRYQLWLSGFQGTEDLPQVWPSWGLVLPH